MRQFTGVASALFASIGAAGCGEVSTNYADAPPPIDAPMIDAEVLTPGSITVTTRARCCDAIPGAITADIEVFVVQPDGSAGPSGRTNGSGVITLNDVLPGASVTAVYAGEDNVDLVTVVGVKPGDAIELGETWTASTGTSSTATANFPADPAAYTYVFHPCGYSYASTGSAATTLYQYDSCQTATADVLFVQYSSSTGQPLRSGTVRNAPYGDGATITLDTWGGTRNIAVNVTGVPSLVTGDLQYRTRPLIGNVQSFYNYYGLPIEGGAASGTVSTADGLDALLTEVSMYRPGDVGQQTRYERLPGTATSHQAAIQEIPWLSGFTGSAAAQVAQWLQIGDQSYDGAVAWLRWSRNLAPLADAAAGEGGQYVEYNWTILLPPGITAWTWGDPPAPIADHVPNRTDNLNADLMYVDLSSADGYDDLRQVPEWHATCPDCAISSGEVTGTITVSYGDGGEGFAPGPSRAPWRRQPVDPATVAPR